MLSMETLLKQRSYPKLNNLGKLCQDIEATENLGKMEKSAMFLSASKGLMSSENWENGKMGKTKKSPTFPRHLSSNFIVTNSQRKFAISLASVRTVLEFLFRDRRRSEMAIHFVGKQKIASLHKKYFADPSPTDCITFPYNEHSFLGEVFVCPDIGEEYVRANGGSLQSEITLYVIHGYLHLLGYDDQTPAERKEMRKEEKKWMSHLVKNGLGVKIKRN